MIPRIALLAALVSMSFALPSQAQAPGQAGWLKLAQAEATCPAEGGRAPRGAIECRGEDRWVCTKNGTWRNTGKRC